jgi:two-component system LytT family response regulator
MIQAIIIDDEEKARVTLVNYLKTYCPEINLLAEADSVESGVDLLNKHQPDVIFLDIMLSDGSGFNLLSRLKHLNFKIVFVTSYSQYAIKALKYSAFDYILKPIDIDELLSVVERLKLIQNAGESAAKMEFLSDTMNRGESDFKKIVLSTHNGIHLVEIDEIIRCEVEDNYTMFYLTNDTRILVSKTLKEYEDLLKDHHFIRVHKSHLVNFKYITKFINNEGGAVVLKNGTEVPVSVRKKDALMQAINTLGIK